MLELVNIKQFKAVVVIYVIKGNKYFWLIEVSLAVSTFSV